MISPVHFKACNGECMLTGFWSFYVRAQLDIYFAVGLLDHVLTVLDDSSCVWRHDYAMMVIKHMHKAYSMC
jgi:hypothetical protein